MKYLFLQLKKKLSPLLDDKLHKGPVLYLVPIVLSTWTLKKELMSKCKNGEGRDLVRNDLLTVSSPLLALHETWMGHCASVSPFIKWGEITQTCLFCCVLYMNPLRHQLKSRKYFHRCEGWVEFRKRCRESQRALGGHAWLERGPGKAVIWGGVLSLDGGCRIESCSQSVCCLGTSPGAPCVCWRGSLCVRLNPFLISLLLWQMWIIYLLEQDEEERMLEDGGGRKSSWCVCVCVCVPCWQCSILICWVFRMRYFKVVPFNFAPW